MSIKEQLDKRVSHLVFIKMLDERKVYPSGPRTGLYLGLYRCTFNGPGCTGECKKVPCQCAARK